MATWQNFRIEAPELAQLAEDRFAATDLLMLGTLRKNGWPRITPIEYVFYEGEFVMGGMWQSKKLLDLLRDPRCVIHSTTSNKDGTQGDAKVYGRALPMDPAREEGYWQFIFARMNWRPDGPAHVFVFEPESAGYVRFGDGGMRMLTWPGAGEWVFKASP